MVSMGEHAFGPGATSPAQTIPGTIKAADPEHFSGSVRWIRADHVIVQLLVADPHSFVHETMDDEVDLDLEVVAIVVVGDGHIDADMDGGPLSLDRGDAVVLDSGPGFDYTADGPIRLLVVKLDADRVPAHIRDAPPLPAGPLPRTRLVNSYIAFVSAMLPTSVDHTTEEPDEYLGRALEDLHIDVLAEAHGRALPEPGSDGLRYRITEFVDSNLGDPTLGPGSIASALGISLRYAHQVFNRDGQTLARFIRDRRLDAVARALRDPRAPVKNSELAARFGFGSRDQLARVFRRRFGMTMREYRDAGPGRPS